MKFTLQKKICCPTCYQSPVGPLSLVSDGQCLTELRFEDRENRDVRAFNKVKSLPVFDETTKWLDDYFNGKKPPIDALPLAPTGSEFCQVVWRILCEVPFGQTLSYGELAKIVARSRGINVMSAQAIGGAMKRNPIPIIIPCHRVVGSNGSLIGYSSGLDIKIKLLRFEGVDVVS